MQLIARRMRTMSAGPELPIAKLRFIIRGYRLLFEVLRRILIDDIT